MDKKEVSTDELIAVILKAIDDVKGEDVKLLDLRELENSVCDYYIICSGNSNTQVNAISGFVQKLVSKELRDKPWSVEGKSTGEWVLMDYVSVAVHIFKKETREFYDLESLWKEGKITTIEGS